MQALPLGTKGTARVTVETAHTAAALGSGDLPVFGTPALVALLEAAAVEAVRAALEGEETSVGTWIDVNHLAASPIGAAIRAEAELTAIDGRMLTFAVRAFDAHEKLAEGAHRRVLVTRERFMRKANAKTTG